MGGDSPDGAQPATRPVLAEVLLRVVYPVLVPVTLTVIRLPFRVRVSDSLDVVALGMAVPLAYHR